MRLDFRFCCCGLGLFLATGGCAIVGVVFPAALPDWVFLLGAGLFRVDLRVSVELGVLVSSITCSSVSFVGMDATVGVFRLVVGKRGCCVGASSVRLRLSASEAEGFLSSVTVDSPLEVELGDPCWCLAGESMPQMPAVTLDALAFFRASFSALRFSLRAFLLARLR